MRRPRPYPVIFILLILLAAAGTVYAKSIDRVVAYVNDQAITERELDVAHNAAIASGVAQSKHESLERSGAVDNNDSKGGEDHRDKNLED